MKTKRILSALFAALMLASTVSCGNAPADAETDSTVNDTTAEDTAPSETTRADLPDNLPEKDYTGKGFNVLVPAWTSELMAAEELNGEVLNDALYNRNLTVAERFNVDLTMTVLDDTSVEMKNVVAAGDDLYQLAAGGIVAMGIDLMADIYMNANDLPYIDFTQPWYSTDVVEQLTYGANNVTFIFIGAYNISSMGMAGCNFYNKDLAEEYGLEDIYTVVQEGRWTKDKMQEMISVAYQDTNGDGVKDEGDRYGFSMDFKGDATGYMYYFGGMTLERQDDGSYKDVFYTEKLVSTMEWLYDLSHNQDYVTCEDAWNHGFNMFVAGNTLMGKVVIRMVEWGLRDTDIDYAIIPHPKWDEAQTKYYSTVAGSSDAQVFLKTIQDKEFSGIITEALNAESWKQVVPAYYDNVLMFKAARDEQSIEMLEIIMNGRVYDFGYVYGAFESNGGGAAFWLNDIMKGNGDLTSYYQKRKSNWENYMASVYAKFDGYEG